MRSDGVRRRYTGNRWRQTPSQSSSISLSLSITHTACCTPLKSKIINRLSGHHTGDHVINPLSGFVGQKKPDPYWRCIHPRGYICLSSFFPTGQLVLLDDVVHIVVDRGGSPRRRSAPGRPLPVYTRKKHALFFPKKNAVLEHLIQIVMCSLVYDRIVKIGLPGAGLPRSSPRAENEYGLSFVSARASSDVITSYGRLATLAGQLGHGGAGL